MAWERFLYAALAEGHGVVVARDRSAVFVAVVLYDLPVAVAVTFEEVAKAGDRSVSSMDRSTPIFVKPDIPLGVLDVAEGMNLLEVPSVDADRLDCSP